MPTSALTGGPAEPPPTYWFICCGVYGAALLISLWQALLFQRYRLKHHGTSEALQKCNSNLAWFAKFLVVSFALRLAWLCCMATNTYTEKCDKGLGPHDVVPMCEHSVLRILNRFSVLTFFTAFSIVATFWREVYYGALDAQAEATHRRQMHGTRIAGTTGGKGCCRNSKVGMVMLNFWLYFIEITVMILVTFNPSKWDKALFKTMYNANYIVVASFFAVLSALMMWYGFRLRRVL